MNTGVEYSAYLVTQDDRSGERSTPEVVTAAIAGGVDVIQLREKNRSIRERYELGLDLRERTAAAGVPLIVNDRVDLALALSADGVHLGDADLPVDVARGLLGERALIGRSVSTIEAARESETEGADYLGVGAIFATGSKDVRDDQAEVGVERVREIGKNVSIPIVGIGGVGIETAREVVTAGADGVAVISAIAGAADPEQATRELRREVMAGREAR